MIIPDVNLLLYTYDSSSPNHPAASAWWQRSLSGSEPVGLAPVVAFGFLRISTNGRVFLNPMTHAESAGHIRSWLQQPCVQLLDPPSGHLEQVLDMLERVGSGGNLVTDAQIAALAIEHDATLHTNDTDFMRFPGLRWLNPLTGQTGTKRRR